MNKKFKPLEDQSPEELVAYIREELRPELQTRRETMDLYDKAFDGFNDVTRNGFLNMVAAFKLDPKDGARRFRALADDVLGTPTKEEETMTDPVVPPTEEVPADTPPQPAAAPAPVEEAPAWAQALVAKVEAIEAATLNSAAQQEQTRINELKAEAVSLGFAEDSEQWPELFRVASSEFMGGDLAKAAEFLKFQEANKAPSDPPAAPPEATKEFPKTAGASGNGAPSPNTAEPVEEVTDFSKGAVHDRAAKFMADRAAAEGAPGVP